MLVYLEIHRVHTPYVALQGRHALRNSRRPCSGQWRPLQNTLHKRFFSYIPPSTLSGHMYTAILMAQNSSPGTSPGLSSAAHSADICSNTKISILHDHFGHYTLTVASVSTLHDIFFKSVQSNTWLPVHTRKDKLWYFVLFPPITWS